MYVCTPMYVCIHVCMYACMYACIHVCMCVCMQACKHVCMYVCMHVRTSGWRSDPSGSTTYILSFPSSGTVLLPRASQMTGRQITESPAMTRSGRSTALPDKHGKHLLSSKAVALLVLTCPYCALLVDTVPYLSLPCLTCPYRACRLLYSPWSNRRRRTPRNSPCPPSQQTGRGRRAVGGAHCGRCR